MAIELTPPPSAQLGDAVELALRLAGLDLAPAHPAYASAWRRAGHLAGVDRSPHRAGDEAARHPTAPAPGAPGGPSR